MSPLTDAEGDLQERRGSQGHEGDRVKGHGQEADRHKGAHQRRVDRGVYSEGSEKNQQRVHMGARHARTVGWQQRDTCVCYCGCFLNKAQKIKHGTRWRCTYRVRTQQCNFLLWEYDSAAAE